MAAFEKIITFNMLGQVHRGLICRRICATPTLRTRTVPQTPWRIGIALRQDLTLGIRRSQARAGKHKR
jgi:hypothetical protein